MVGAPARFDIAPLGDRAVVVRFGDRIDPAITDFVLAAWRRIARAKPEGVIDLVPAYTTLTVHYDWRRMPQATLEMPWQWLIGQLQALLTEPGGTDASSMRIVHIPVCYEGDYAPDLADVARAVGLSPADVVRRHSAADYRVAFLGFRPGFPYLLGLDPALAVPRLATPRLRIPAGSVGLGGAQTGIYPAAGAGGWRLIGRSPMRLFDIDREPPAMLAPGDRVRFVPIDAAEFERLAHEAAAQGMENNSAAASAAFDVLSPGIHSSLQDGGRPGWRHLGITAAGASDTVALDIANALVGNPPATPVIEMTLRGPTLRLHAALTLALTGTGMVAFADDEPVPFARPVDIAAGVRLSFKSTGAGARAWLAIAGGLDVSRWLGSASADVGSGVFGRTLKAGDRFALATARSPKQRTSERLIRASTWWVEAAADIDEPMILRFVPDADADPDLPGELAGHVWRASTAADRTGVRLEGPALAVGANARRISFGVLHGTIQIPPDGQPILLGPDGQTVGGYPVAGHIIEADLPRLAQLKPGDALWLQPLALEEARAARQAQAALLGRLHVAISGRLRATPGKDRE